MRRNDASWMNSVGVSESVRKSIVSSIVSSSFNSFFSFGGMRESVCRPVSGQIISRLVSRSISLDILLAPTVSKNTASLWRRCERRFNVMAYVLAQERSAASVVFWDPTEAAKGSEGEKMGREEDLHSSEWLLARISQPASFRTARGRMPK